MWFRFFLNLERSQILTFNTHIEENVEDEDDTLVEDLIETKYCNGTKEVVKNFNQKYVISCGGDIAIAFRQCGHQCICEQCYPNKVILIYQNVLFVEKKLL